MSFETTFSSVTIMKEIPYENGARVVRVERQCHSNQCHDSIVFTGCHPSHIDSFIDALKQAKEWLKEDYKVSKVNREEVSFSVENNRGRKSSSGVSCLNISSGGGVSFLNS